MARPREYDQTTVLTAVMHAFRRRGFAATSVRDLETATGVTSGSLYNSYGDKRGLFLSLLDEPGGGTAGCLITNSAIEFGETEMPGFVGEAFVTLRDVFSDRLGGDEAEALATLALYQGVLVLVRAGYETGELGKMINTHFDTLEKHDER